MAVNRVKQVKIVDYTTIKLDLPDSKFYRLSRYLPDSIRHLLRLIDNPREIQRLINKYGGQSIQVPRKYNDDSGFLSGIFSTENIGILITAYAGTIFYIPSCKIFKIRTMRNDVLMCDFNKLVDSAYSVRQAITVVRLKFGLCERRVRQIISIKNSLKS